VDISATDNLDYGEFEITGGPPPDPGLLINTATVTNNGQGNVNISLSGPALPYVVTANGCAGTLAPSGNCGLDVQFVLSGLSAGDYPEQLDISTLQDTGVVETVYLTARVLTAIANRPASFFLNSPADSATLTNSPSQLFVWNSSSDPQGGQIIYDLFFCDNVNFIGCPDPLPSVDGVINNAVSVDISNIPSGVPVSWKVVAEDPDGDRTDSTDTRSFTVAP
jgi:hypothetical protein